jgi:hypothetical protein
MMQTLQNHGSPVSRIRRITALVIFLPVVLQQKDGQDMIPRQRLLIGARFQDIECGLFGLVPLSRKRRIFCAPFIGRSPIHPRCLCRMVHRERLAQRRQEDLLLFF